MFVYFDETVIPIITARVIILSCRFGSPFSTESFSADVIPSIKFPHGTCLELFPGDFLAGVIFGLFWNLGNWHLSRLLPTRDQYIVDGDETKKKKKQQQKTNKQTNTQEKPWGQETEQQ